MPQKRNNIFWVLVLSAYALTVFLSFLRIYVYKDYPIFYTEEEMPSIEETVVNTFNAFKL